MKKKQKTTDEHFESEELNFEASFQINELIAPTIGHIVIGFNALTDSLEDFLTEEINEDDENPGWIIMAHLSFQQKVNLFSDLSRHRNSEEHLGLEDQLNKLVKNLQKAGEQRNLVVHANWEMIDKELYVKSKTKVNKKGVRHDFIKVNLKSLVDIEELMDDVEEELGEYLKKVNPIYT